MREGWNRLSLTIPSLAVFLFLFVAPLCYFLVVSFWTVRAYQLIPSATLQNYATVFNEYGLPLAFTFAISLATSVLVLVLAFAFAYLCRFRAGRYGVPLLFVALITLFGGYLTKIYVWKTILGSEGILNTALMEIGLISEPIKALLFNPGAVVLTLTHYTLPFAILPIYGSLRSVDDVPLEAARDLGASQSKVFWQIILPQCRVGIISAFTLTFLFVAGDYVTPKLVGGPYTSMIGVFIQSQFGHRLNQPLGSAMAFSVILISLLTVSIISLILKKALRPK
jgi:spermidine/putrescine transport system permease protein